jgi:hypothetical protein
MKHKSNIITAFMVLGIVLSNFSLPIVDLKSLLPLDIYTKYYRGEIISLVGNNILILIIIWQSYFYENKADSPFKRRAIILVLILMDLLAIWMMYARNR